VENPEGEKPRERRILSMGIFVNEMPKQTRSESPNVTPGAYPSNVHNVPGTNTP
jgi:hypothetical protein